MTISNEKLNRISGFLEGIANSHGLTPKALHQKVGELLTENENDDIVPVSRDPQRFQVLGSAVGKVVKIHKPAAKGGIKAYWDGMTPEERKAEGKRRMGVALKKKAQRGRKKVTPQALQNHESRTTKKMGK